MIMAGLGTTTINHYNSVWDLGCWNALFSIYNTFLFCQQATSPRVTECYRLSQLHWNVFIITWSEETSWQQLVVLWGLRRLRGATSQSYCWLKRNIYKWSFEKTRPEWALFSVYFKILNWGRKVQKYEILLAGTTLISNLTTVTRSKGGEGIGNNF